MGSNEFRFFLSCDINLPVTFRVERLEGTLPSVKSPNSGISPLNLNFDINFMSFFPIFVANFPMDRY